MFPISNTTIPSACNASSEHACCSEHTGWCGSTKYHCENPKSSDFSKLVPSNVAVWQQLSNKCKLEEISREAACDLLNSNQFILIFIGMFAYSTLNCFDTLIANSFLCVFVCLIVCLLCVFDCVCLLSVFDCACLLCCVCMSVCSV